MIKRQVGLERWRIIRDKIIINNNDRDKMLVGLERWRIIRDKIITNNGSDKKTSRIREIKDNTRQNYY